MQSKKNPPSDIKASLHPRNSHQGRYDLDALMGVCPALGRYLHVNVHGNRSIDFFDPLAVLALNKALLLLHYDMEYWEIPEGFLCPPIPGRADYIHHMADVLAAANKGLIPTGPELRCLDIGVGASCIYPILGRSAYGWSFIGSDIDEIALDSARLIIASNSLLSEHVQCRLQTRPADILHGVLQKGEFMDLLICNPPFHASAAQAKAGSMRKLRNLKGEKVSKPVLNFGGQSHELWTEGGEKGFILRLIEESTSMSQSCAHFSTLVSKESHLKPLLTALAKAKALDYKVIEMGQGNKVSRILTWTFMRAE